MRIIIDAMGGDNAPGEIVKGAIDAAAEFGVDITLVGRQEDIVRCLGRSKSLGGIDVVNATEVVEMEDDPSLAVRRKRDSSMTVSLNMLADGQGDAVISAGSTGALLTGATLLVKRVKGIRRAALAPVLPAGENGAVLIDCGANVECTAEQLLQFAYMGSLYSKNMLGCANPRVGLLNVGAEETKGTPLQHQAYGLLKTAAGEGNINFIGNIEARDVFSGEADVLVADGFTGNILLKSIEGTAAFLMKSIKEILVASTMNKLAAAVIKKEVQALRNKLDSGEVGGTALLGISKPVIKAHGSSDARAIRSAVKQAIDFVNGGVITEIENNISNMKIVES